MEPVVRLVAYLALLVVTLCLAVYLYVARRYSFWKRHNVPFVEPELPFGNFKELGKSVHPAHLSQRFYERYKDIGQGFVGLYIFLNPVLLVTELRMVKRILIEDFHYFPDRGVYFNERHDPLSAHLFSLEGSRWRDLRSKITPTFTSGRMKSAFPLVLDTALRFCEFLQTVCGDSTGNAVEVRDLMARFTTDVIGSYAFGLNCNSFGDPDNEFRRIGRKHFDTPRNHPLAVFLMKTFRGLANTLGLKLIHDDVAAFFSGTIRSTVEHRERTDERRNDFLDLLISLKNTGMLEGANEIVGRLTFEEIAAQAFIFFTAGFETSASAMTYTLYELALYGGIQQRARDCVLGELDRHDGQLTYDSFKNMLYLDQCIYETLRKYPPVAVLERTVAKQYKIPGTAIVLPVGMKIMIPAYAIHHDPAIYPDPHRYDPDRFTPELMARRNPCAYLPFGEGPRICVGLRFGLMQARIGLALLLKHFRVLPCEDTEVPLTYSTTAFVLTPVNGVRLRLERYE